MEQNLMNKVSVGDLQLGDIIAIGDFPYCYSTVVKICGDSVEIVRPYIHISDYSMMAHLYDQEGIGVIEYIGMERLVLNKQYSYSVILARRLITPVK
jgi:hypothetical protein